MSEHVRIAIAMTDGRVFHMTVESRGRFPSPPKQGGWVQERNAAGEWSGWYVRQVTDAVIEHELDRASFGWALDERGPALPVTWRRISADESVDFERHRLYRNAMTLREGRIERDIDKARECHRNHLRRLRISELAKLDAQWMRATGQGDKKAAAAIEKQRQQWRDAPADPRIDAARTVEGLKALLE